MCLETVKDIRSTMFENLQYFGFRDVSFAGYLGYVHEATVTGFVEPVLAGVAFLSLLNLAATGRATHRKGAVFTHNLNLAVFEHETGYKSLAGLCHEIMFHGTSVPDKSYGIFLCQEVIAIGTENGEGTLVINSPEIIAGPSGSALQHLPLATDRTGSDTVQLDFQG